jgi:hypothetical protein
MRHCDDYIDDDAACPALRKFLQHARMSAHGMLSEEPRPALFADHRGRRVRVTMASRMGDVGITITLTATNGYDARCAVEDLSNFGETP